MYGPSCPSIKNCSFVFALSGGPGTPVNQSNHPVVQFPRFAPKGLTAELLAQLSLSSSHNIVHPVMSCFWLLTHLIWYAFTFALASAGSSSPARMAMMALTT